MTIETVKSSIQIATYLPDKVVTNGDIEACGVRVSEREGILTAQKIYSKTGVLRRHVAADGETVLDMALKVAEGINFGSIDFSGFTTSYPDGVDNAAELSWMLQRRGDLNLVSTDHLNVHAACSGFTRFLSFITEKREEFDGKRILIAASEIYWPYLPDLRKGQIQSGYPQTIFGDGSSIVAFTVGRDIHLLASVDHNFKDTNMPPPIRMPINYNLMKGPAIVEEVAPSESGLFEMDGKPVFETVISKVPDLILQVIKKAGLTPEDIAMVFPHPGSRHMVDALRRRLSPLKLFSYLDDGNLSSASIPLALGTALDQGVVKKGDNIVLAGFGAGNPLYASLVAARLG